MKNINIKGGTIKLLVFLLIGGVGLSGCGKLSTSTGSTSTTSGITYTTGDIRGTLVTSGLSTISNPNSKMTYKRGDGEDSIEKNMDFGSILFRESFALDDIDVGYYNLSIVVTDNVGTKYIYSGVDILVDRPFKNIGDMVLKQIGKVKVKLVYDATITGSISMGYSKSGVSQSDIYLKYTDVDVQVASDSTSEQPKVEHLIELPVGTHTLTIKTYDYNSNEKIFADAEVSNITITAGQTTDAGTIYVSSLNSTSIQSSSLQTDDINDSNNDVPRMERLSGF